MRYPAYSAHHPQTAEGIRYPSGWRLQRLRFAVHTNPVKSEVAGWLSDTPVSFVPMEAIGETGCITGSQKRAIGDVYNGYSYFADGDVVVAKITPCFENGKGALAVGLNNGVGFGTTELHVLRASDQVLPRWLLYLTQSHTFRKLGEAEMYGAGGQKRVPEDFIKNHWVGLPTPDEQEHIANFLDWKTGQIDALIAKKQRLVDLLAELRQSVIDSRTATWGSEQFAESSRSGQIRLKYATSLIVDCPHETPEYDPDGDYQVVRTADMDCGVLQLEAAYRVSEPEYQRRIRRSAIDAGDILYGREGERWGHAALAPLSDQLCLGQRMMQFRAAPEFDAQFVMWQLNSRWVYQQGEVDTVGSTAPHVNVETIRNFRLHHPPRAVQVTAAAETSKQVESLNRLVASAMDAITQLREYRSALITAATTGQIDVRGVAVPAAA